MPTQPGLPIPRNLSRQFQPNAGAVAAARSYAPAWNAKGLGDAQANPERHYAMALEYRDAMREPSERPGIRESYQALGEHINRQYEHMTKPAAEGGMGLRHEVVSHDPYDTPETMAADVKSGRIKSLATAVTGPSAGLDDTTNDRFRAIHDVFGHTTTGRGFSRHGEEAAYQAHAQMFPAAARPALASDLRAQNAMLVHPWLHDAAPAATGEKFVGQSEKLIGLPDWVHDDAKPVPPRSPFKGPSKLSPQQFRQPALF